MKSNRNDVLNNDNDNNNNHNCDDQLQENKAKDELMNNYKLKLIILDHIVFENSNEVNIFLNNIHGLVNNIKLCKLLITFDNNNYTMFENMKMNMFSNVRIKEWRLFPLSLDAVVKRMNTAGM